MSTVEIKIDAVDITDDVYIKEASFTSLVNGTPGLASFKVKDKFQTYEFTSGGSLTLDVDSVRVWGGYVSIARKSYPLIVDTTDGTVSLTRTWTIGGTDYNTLFGKRVVYDSSDPDGHIDFSYDADTYDDTIILDIFNNYLDISGDGITTSGVERIAKAILDVPGKSHSGQIARAGMYWRDMMTRVQRATGGVYYISPTKVLTYVDVESATNSHTLTDVPSGSDVGYREFALIENASKMVNDMLVWGAALGSNHIVFSRTEDSSSISSHGRWQQALFSSGLYRQASVDIVADSYVYGTPQSHRGGKDNAISFTCKVKSPVYAAGDVVNVESNLFGYADALPVRRMTTTFVNPTEPVFDLLLSHEIDEPVSIFEIAPVPGVGPGPGPGGVDPPPPNPPAPCEPCVITDTFTREVDEDWETSDSGRVWTAQYQNGGAALVDGSRGILYLFNTVPLDVYASMSLDYGATNGSVNTLLSGVQASFTGVLTTQGITYQIHPNYPGSAYGVQFFYYLLSGVPTQYFAALDGAGSNTFSTAGVDGLQPCDIRIEQSPTIFRVKIWQTGDPEPSVWSFQSTNLITVDTGGVFNIQGDSLSAGLFEVLIDRLDIDRCSGARFDTFDDRTVVDGWGDPSSGLTTWLDTGPGVYTSEVTGGSGFIRTLYPGAGPGIGGQSHMVIPPSGSTYLPAISDPESTFTTRFRWTNLPDVNVGVDLVTYQNPFYLFHGWGIDGDNPDQGIGIFVRDPFHSNLDGIQLVRYDDGTTTFSTVFGTWQEDQWYWLKGQRANAGATIRCKLWADGDPEPISWLLEENGDTSATPLHWMIFRSVDTPTFFNSPYNANNVENEWDFIDFAYTTEPCIGDDGPYSPYPGSTPSGSTLEQIVNQYGGVVFSAAAAFVSGSLKVYINGTRQFGVTETEPSTGTFTLTEAATTTDIIQVEYIHVGNPIPPTPPVANGSYPGDTTLAHPSVNSDTMPGYLAEITDSTWGTKTRRITNTNLHRNQYARHQSWNKNGTRMYFPGYGGHLYDGVTYADLGAISPSIDYGIWSNIESNYIYGVKTPVVNVFRRWDISTGTGTDLHTFSGYSSLYVGNYEGALSDGDRVALLADSRYVIIYDIPTDTIISTTDMGTTAIDNCSISRGGNYFVTSFSTSGTGATQGNRLYSATTGAYIRRVKEGSGGHADQGRNAAGEEIYVHIDDDGTGVFTHRLSDGQITFLIGGVGGVCHISCTNYDRWGWAYISSTANLPSADGNGQIFAVKTDGSLAVEVFGFHHHGSETDYDSSPFAAPNRTGDRVTWGGRWGASTTYGFVSGVTT
jgi:hypothetical protein